MRTANKNEYSMSIQEAMDMTGMSRNFIINAAEQGKWPGTVITVKGRRTVHIPRIAFMHYLGISEDNN